MNEQPQQIRPGLFNPPQFLNVSVADDLVLDGDQFASEPTFFGDAEGRQQKYDDAIKSRPFIQNFWGRLKLWAQAPRDIRRRSLRERANPV